MIPIEEQITTIRVNKVSGSTTLVHQALVVLKNAAAHLKEKNPERMRNYADMLINAKPEMAAMHNIINKATERYASSNDFNEFNAAIGEIINDMEKALTDTLNKAYNILFPDGDIEKKILTCSYSNTIVQFVKKLVAAGKKPEIFALESKFNGLKYGENLVRDIKSLRVEAYMVPDDQVELQVTNSDFIIIGCDRIMPDGSVINGYPSYELAEKALTKCPMYVIGESFKKGERFEPERGFQSIPKEMITEIITDNVF